MEPDTEELIAGLRPWIETESPTEEPARVNAVMDLAQAELVAAGATVRRVPGRDGAGDHLSGAMPWGGEGRAFWSCPIWTLFTRWGRWRSCPSAARGIASTVLVSPI